MVEVESENFDEIKNINKLCHGEKADLTIIIWDYFHDVVMKHILDDFSQVCFELCGDTNYLTPHQYPFWAAKIAVTAQQHTFGLPVIEAWMSNLRSGFEQGPADVFQVSRNLSCTTVA